MSLTSGNSTTFVAGNWPASKAYALLPLGAGANDATTTYAATGALGATGFGLLRPNQTASPGAPAEPVSPVNTCWILTNKDTPTTVTQPIQSIASGTWIVTIVLTFSVTWTGSLKIVFRAFHSTDSFGSPTKITLTTPSGGTGPDANGWVESSAATLPLAATTETVTLTMTSVGAVTVGGDVLGFEFGIDETATGLLGATITAAFTVQVPALTYNRGIAENTAITTDTVARVFVGARGVAENTASPTDTAATEDRSA